MSYSYLFKFIVVGDSGVGKSCLVKRFIDGIYNRYFETTLGVEFASKLISINDTIIKEGTKMDN